MAKDLKLAYDGLKNKNAQMTAERSWRRKRYRRSLTG